MYVPAHFGEPDHDVVMGLVRGCGFGHLVCHDDDGLTSTPLPFVVDDGLTSVRAHLARPNPMWRRAPCDALLIVPVADAYVSPSWYPAKAVDGKVVPTWNYEVVHLRGRLEVRDDPAWIRQQIGDLTMLNESSMPKPWAVEDAPDDFIEAHARAIIGIELLVERVEAKRKLSQNRSDADRQGVIEGLKLRTGQSNPIANAMGASGGPPEG
jgi:transcriptional regulator